LLLNIGFLGVFIAFEEPGDLYIEVMTFITSGLILIKTLGSLLYAFNNLLRRCCRRSPYKSPESNESSAESEDN